MFDIGFPELLLVSIVALLVIGPERLPETIRTVSLWLGRLRRSFTDLKLEIESEIGADEIRQQLHNEHVMKSLKDARDQVDDAVDDTKQKLNEIKDPVGQLIKESQAASEDTDTDTRTSSRSTDE